MVKRYLINYVPEYLTDYRELEEIYGTEQPEIDALWGAAENVMDDQFIQTATENGVQRWEKILGITPKATEPFEDRRFRVLTRLSGQVPYTMRALQGQMDILCGEGGYTILLDNAAYKIDVKVGLTARNNFDDVRVLLDRMLPANLLVHLSLLYNQHSLWAGYTHEQMAAYTHDQLRNEVIP